MQAKFNPSGTHIHKGKLKVRIDLYPDVMDKVYAQHYVDKPDRPYTEEEMADEALRALVPTHKELNPCLCHFIQVDANITQQALIGYVRSIFTRSALVELDDALFNDRRDRVQRLMRHKVGSGEKLRLPISQKAEEKLVGQLNYRFADLEVEV